MDIDRIAIYQKLVAIKPFFQDVEKIKKRKADAKTAFETGRTATLVATGGTWVEVEAGTVMGGGPRRPRVILYSA